jgi:hypothetical protein
MHGQTDMILPVVQHLLRLHAVSFTASSLRGLETPPSLRNVAFGGFFFFTNVQQYEGSVDQPRWRKRSHMAVRPPSVSGKVSDA